VVDVIVVVVSVSLVHGVWLVVASTVWVETVKTSSVSVTVLGEIIEAVV
jgi:hypothetical protein